MDASVTSFIVEITPTGGIVKGTTTAGPFQVGPFNNYSYLSAIATILTGPNPMFDSQYSSFSCRAGAIV